MAWWGIMLLCIAVFIVGAIIGFFLARKLIIDQLKKNPPINTNMIRALYSQMGRKPSEVQINSIMNSIKNQQG